MAAVVTFWQLPDEEDQFLHYLERSGDVVAIRHLEAVTDPKAIRALPVAVMAGRSDSERLYLTLRTCAERIPLHYWEPETPGEPGRYSVDSQLFPAIIYDRGTQVGDRLERSNAACSGPRSDSSFTNWQRRVFAWLRRATPHWHEYPGYRVSRKAAKASLNGLVLVPYHGWSGDSTGRSSFA